MREVRVPRGRSLPPRASASPLVPVPVRVPLAPTEPPGGSAAVAAGTAPPAEPGAGSPVETRPPSSIGSSVRVAAARQGESVPARAALARDRPVRIGGKSQRTSTLPARTSLGRRGSPRRVPAARPSTRAESSGAGVLRDGGDVRGSQPAVGARRVDPTALGRTEGEQRVARATRRAIRWGDGGLDPVGPRPLPDGTAGAFRPGRFGERATPGGTLEDRVDLSALWAGPVEDRGRRNDVFHRGATFRACTSHVLSGEKEFASLLRVVPVPSPELPSAERRRPVDPRCFNARRDPMRGFRRIEVAGSNAEVVQPTSVHPAVGYVRRGQCDTAVGIRGSSRRERRRASSPDSDFTYRWKARASGGAR